ncbi:MAG: hypothetical protein KY449_08270 [Proteobacteria bacterium]|nr:hypothetical protein [Pseudomonadota bacterium]
MTERLAGKIGDAVYGSFALHVSQRMGGSHVCLAHRALLDVQVDQITKRPQPREASGRGALATVDLTLYIDSQRLASSRRTKVSPT